MAGRRRGASRSSTSSCRSWACFGGTLAGLFALGIFTRRASAAGATVGAAASLALLAWVALATDLSGLLYAAVAVVSCVVVGLAREPRRCRDPAGSLEGLTIYTLDR